MSPKAKCGGTESIEIILVLHDWDICISGLVTANTVMGVSIPGQRRKDADLQKDQVFKKMVRAAQIKGQLKQVQDSVAELAKMIE